MGQYWAAEREKRFWLLREPGLAAPCSATATPTTYKAMLPNLASAC